jgi:hypothetical protein
MDLPDPPGRGTATGPARAAEERGLEVARWAGGGDEERGLSMLGLASAAAYFVSLFLPWLGGFSAWTLRTAVDSGVLALAVVLVELLLVTGAWVSRGAALAVFCLTAAAGVMGVTTWVTFQWGGATPGTEALDYGAWLGFVVALVLVAVAALRLSVLRRPVS